MILELLFCNSFSLQIKNNDQVICLKTAESSSDICFTLSAENKTLIDSNNEKYIKE